MNASSVSAVIHSSSPFEHAQQAFADADRPVAVAALMEALETTPASRVPTILLGHVCRNGKDLVSTPEAYQTAGLERLYVISPPVHGSSLWMEQVTS